MGKASDNQGNSSVKVKLDLEVNEDSIYMKVLDDLVPYIRDIRLRDIVVKAGHNGNRVKDIFLMVYHNLKKIAVKEPDIALTLLKVQNKLAKEYLKNGKSN